MAKRMKLIVQDDDMGRGTYVVKPALRGLSKHEAEDILFCFEAHCILLSALVEIRRIERQRKKCGVGFDEQVSDTAEKTVSCIVALAKATYKSRKR